MKIVLRGQDMISLAGTKMEFFYRVVMIKIMHIPLLKKMSKLKMSYLLRAGGRR